MTVNKELGKLLNLTVIIPRPQGNILVRVTESNRTNRVDIYYKGDLLDQFTQYGPGSPTMAVFTLEKLRAW